MCVRESTYLGLRYPCFLSSNQTEIYVLFSLNRWQIYVCKPDAEHKAVSCAVEVRAMDNATFVTKWAQHGDEAQDKHIPFFF
jgi:hypothetical protein